MEIYMYIVLLFFGIFNLFALYTLRAIIKVNKKQYNPFNKAFFVLILLMYIADGASLLLYILEEIEELNFTEISFGYLKITNITSFFIVEIIFLFFLYLKGLKAHYSLPFIIGFYDLLAFALFDITAPTVFSSLVIVTFLVIYILYKSVTNKDGKLLSIVLYFITIYFANSVVWPLHSDSARLYYVFFSVVEYFFLFLGVNGTFDKYIYYDRKKEKEIRNAWISKMFSPEKQMDIKNQVDDLKSKSIVIECPICLKKEVYKISEGIMKNIKKSSKPLSELKIAKDAICEHEFTVYVSKEFKVIGYKPIELMSS
ncbi:MAG: hypothetical protein ACTSVI_08690 [Promethearchaeota archaeon]